MSDSVSNALYETTTGYWPMVDMVLTFERRNEIYKYRIILPYIAATMIAICGLMNSGSPFVRHSYCFLAIIIHSLILINLALTIGVHSKRTPYVGEFQLNLSSDIN